MNRILRLINFFRRDIATLIFAIFNRKTPGKIRLGMLAALLYFISPIDLIPDTIPVLGVMDDAVLVPMAMMFLTNMLPESVKAETAHYAWKYEKYVPVVIAGVVLFILAWIFLVFYGLFSLIFG